LNLTEAFCGLLSNLGQKTSRLLILIHPPSMVFLGMLEDFQTAYEQVSRGEAIHLPPKTTSFKQWAERLQSTRSQQNCSKSRTTGWQSGENRSLACP